MCLSKISAGLPRVESVFLSTPHPIHGHQKPAPWLCSFVMNTKSLGQGLPTLRGQWGQCETSFGHRGPKLQGIEAQRPYSDKGRATKLQNGAEGAARHSKMERGLSHMGKQQTSSLRRAPGEHQNSCTTKGKDRDKKRSQPGSPLPTLLLRRSPSACWTLCRAPAS